MKPVLPRYTVGSVTGHHIPASLANNGRRDKPAPTIWYVTDRLHCHRVMGEYFNTGDRRGHISGEGRARFDCDWLNTEYEQWLRDEGIL